MRARVTAGLLIFATLVACSSKSSRRTDRADEDDGDRRSARRTDSADAAAAGSSAPFAPNGQLLDATSHAVVAGVLAWADPQVRAFNPEGRKDRELGEALRERARLPAGDVALLLDAQATRAGITQALRAAAAKTKARETLLFYYAGHGVRDEKGDACFASSDLDLKRTAATCLSLADIEGALTDVPRGARVLLLADSCFSGALATVAEQLSKRGVLAAALTSAEASNTSTVNWTFTQTLLDTLAGDALADRNHDGTITLGELSSEARDALKYRDGQRSGFALFGLGDPPVAAARAAPASPADSKLALGSYVRTSGPHAETARVVGTEKGAPTLRFLHYATVSERALPASEITPIAFKTYAVGSAVDVSWNGRGWDAKVTAVDGDFMRITYIGWPAYWDEWVLDARILGESQRPTQAPRRSVGR